MSTSHVTKLESGRSHKASAGKAVPPARPPTIPQNAFRDGDVLWMAVSPEAGAKDNTQPTRKHNRPGTEHDMHQTSHGPHGTYATTRSSPPPASRSGSPGPSCPGQLRSDAVRRRRTPPYGRSQSSPCGTATPAMTTPPASQSNGTPRLEWNTGRTPTVAVQTPAPSKHPQPAISPT